ncbi:MAG: ATP-dependent helicase HrpB [Gammaproteobacteria bacterium]|nr:ATP-dependent helicase HrpB [Gammaproteobacteria bacterium]
MTLPIDEILSDLRLAVANYPGVVLQAPPGAGKTTRVPLALLNEGWLGDDKIIMLEPRRLAARNVANFMAASLGEQVGDTIGYRVRQDSRVGPKTRIEIVTEGVLTRMLQSDPELAGIGIVIFDEFHERSLQADLGLALCLESQAALRDDLKLLVMSATLDGAATARLLGDAPIVTSEGHSFPVEVRYAAPPPHASRQQLQQHAVTVTLEALKNETGSALMFLPGAAEIRRAEESLRSCVSDDILITPLYGDLSLEAQELAIQAAPQGKRKVVIATNIAETSLTIEGIRIVVDSGLTRTPRFEPTTGLTRLETVQISQASAEQRRGRAGRLEAGVCYRLWPEGRHLLTHGAPEIVEADLAPLALELARWGCRDPAQLCWLDPPPQATYRQAVELLQRLGALDHDQRITEHGNRMADLPMHPRIAHMVLQGMRIGAGRLACEIAALLSERDLLRKSANRDSDLRTRLALLQNDGGEASRGTLRQVRQSARQWQRQLNIKDDAPDAKVAGALIGYAYPDRIAQRRPGKDNRYLLANGRGATFVEYEPLADEPYLVVADLTSGEREARVHLAAAIDIGQIEVYFADLIETDDAIRWSGREKAVMALRQRRLGSLVLEEKTLDRPDPERVRAALIEGIRETGVDCLPWNASSRDWQKRVQFLHRLEPEAWPDVSDDALLQTLEQWLAPFLDGTSRLTHLSRLDLQVALDTLIPWPQQRLLDVLAPTHIQVPSGSRIAIDYDNDPPVLAVRLQEMFGATDTPAIAGEKVKLLIHLLSPARRPLQVTQDLKGFWRSSYHEVKKEMKGRYPKHYWPDDPLQAEPTRRPKPRD